MSPVQAAEPPAATRADVELESLRQKVLSLEAQLQKDLLPQAEDAAAAASQHKEKLEALRDALGALAHGRLEAAEEVRQLTKSQLAEIKHLMKDPPGILRRLLLMLWLLLHHDRFRSRQAVQVDEFKDWPRCQRMLADDGFVSHILNFDPSTLDQVPKVTAFIESCFSLHGVLDQAAGPSPEPPSRSATPEPGARRPGSAPTGEVPKPAATLAAASPRLPPEPPPARRRPATTRWRPGSPASISLPSSPASILRSPKRVFAAAPRLARSAALPPLPGVQAVARASAPCGVLIRWMHELLMEQRKRRHVLRDLGTVELQLQEAQERASSAERSAASAGAALARARSSVRVWEAEQVRAEELCREHEQKQRELGQLREAVRNNQLEAALRKGGIDLEKEIVSYQVRQCGKLGTMEARNF